MRFWLTGSQRGATGVPKSRAINLWEKNCLRQELGKKSLFCFMIYEDLSMPVKHSLDLYRLAQTWYLSFLIKTSGVGR